jgi:anti-sigma regulatory factor (Ser/Thr protein kinase)
MEPLLPAGSAKSQSYTRPVCELPQAGFQHEAFFYAGTDEFLIGVLAFVDGGLNSDEAVLVALPATKLDLVRRELGGERERVRFADIEGFGRNPARIIPAWQDFLDEHLTAGRAVRGVGEPIWAGRSAAELDECERHEALLNQAFEGAPAWSLMCPYDAAGLDDCVLETAERNHPLVCRDGELEGSRSFSGPPGLEALDGTLEPPPSNAAELSFTIGRLAELRRFVAEQAGRTSLSAGRIADLVLAANELATNSLRHGGGEGSLRLWSRDGALACEVDDRGRIDGPLVGRRRPRPDQVGGRGLWLANLLCDLVQIRSGKSGTAVRLQMSIAT